MTNAINWFSIPVKDLSRARKFYEDILKIEMNEMNMGPSKMAFFPTKDGVGGSLNHQEQNFKPLQYVSVYLSTSDLEGSLSRVSNSGGNLITEKTQISPDFGYFGVISDTEGNIVGLHSYQ